MPVTTRRSRADLRNTASSSSTLRQRTAPSPSPSPAAPDTDASSPASQLPDSTLPSRASSVTTATMFSREQSSTLRGRNVEDTMELEEKGLLMRRTPTRSREQSPDYKSSPSEKGKGKGKETRLEKVVMHEELGEGLNNKRDREAFALLVVLYLLQGIPLGLTFGTLPFLLKPHLSYSQLAVFALSTWPYSLKLLWSPIVDAWFVPKWGRRKSWIVPVQTIVGIGLWIIGGRVDKWLMAVSSLLSHKAMLSTGRCQYPIPDLCFRLPHSRSSNPRHRRRRMGVDSSFSAKPFLRFNCADYRTRDRECPRFHRFPSVQFA